MDIRGGGRLVQYRAGLPKPTIGYIPQLDGLRAIAVMLVMVWHWVPASHWDGGPQWGTLGVQLFFVLSGFLITGILLRARDDAGHEANLTAVVKSFYMRRFLRIFPLYYAVVIAITALDAYAARESFWFNITYTSNLYFFMRDSWYSNVSHFWSLAVEEQFYLVWPWVILYMPPRRLVGTVVGFVAVGVAAKMLLTVLLPSRQLVGILPFGAWDALGGGALLAVLVPGSPRWRTFVWWCGLGGSTLWIAVWAAGPTGIWQSTLAMVQEVASALVCVSVVGCLSVSPPVGVGHLMRFPPLVGIGIISYGIYILHVYVPILWRIGAQRAGLPEVWVSSPVLPVLCWFLVTIALAALSWFAYEKPLNRLKARFPYPRAADPDGVVSA